MAVDRAVLEQAAHRWGVQLDYYDCWGNHHVASDRTLSGILNSLGVATNSNAQVNAAIRQHDLAYWSHPLGETNVIYDDFEALRLRVPESDAGRSIKIEIEWEDGELQHHPYWLPELPELERAKFNGVTYIAKRLPLPRPLRLGYHTIRVYWVEEPSLALFGEARLIVCPRRAYEIPERLAGLAISLYGLRSRRNWGVGDFTDLDVLVNTFAAAGASFIALNPLHAIPNRVPYNTSPYLPECSLYRNWLYLDVERVPGYSRVDAPAPDLLEELRANDFVQYERVAEIKAAALRPAFARFEEAGGDPALDAYIAEQGEPLRRFAIYAALWGHIHAQSPEIWLWRDWPAEYQDPDSPAVAKFAAEHPLHVRYHQFLQWQVDVQIAEVQTRARALGMKIGLYHDLALATDKFGADLWADRPFYATGSRVGAPPDELAPSGQDWGFPPPNRDAHRTNGYERFAQTIRNSARHGGALRIDHVMRFFRLYWIPEGIPAGEGTYVLDYAEDLIAILALESVRGKFIIIGEDLGTVEPSARVRLSQSAILSYRLLWFERREDGGTKLPDEYPELAAVSITTHDLPTVAGFFQGKDIEARRAAGLVNDEEYAHQWESRRSEIARLEAGMAEAGFPFDALGFMLSTPSRIGIINQEDLTGETDQQNLPATTWEHPNWSRKMMLMVDELSGIAAEFRERAERSGRLSGAMVGRGA